MNPSLSSPICRRRRLLFVFSFVSFFVFARSFSIQSLDVSSSYLTEGDSLELLCKLNNYWEYCTFRHGNKLCDLEWKRSLWNIEITNCSDYKTRVSVFGDYNNYECGIRLSNVTTEDGGLWSCHVENYYNGYYRGYGYQDESQIQLDIFSKVTTSPSPPNITTSSTTSTTSTTTTLKTPSSSSSSSNHTLVSNKTSKDSGEEEYEEDDDEDLYYNESEEKIKKNNLQRNKKNKKEELSFQSSLFVILTSVIGGVVFLVALFSFLIILIVRCKRKSKRSRIENSKIDSILKKDQETEEPFISESSSWKNEKKIII